MKKEYLKNWRLKKTKRVTRRNGRVKSRRRESKWSSGNRNYGRYVEILQDPINEKIWNDYLKRVARMRKDIIKKVNIKSNSSKNQVIDAFVEFIRIVTEFYDEGMPKVFPREKLDLMKDIGRCFPKMVRRGDYISLYCNFTKPGEKVTTMTLGIGSAIEIEKKDISNYTLVREEDGVLHAIIVPMIPASIWKQGKICTVDGNKVNINIEKFERLLIDFKDIVLKICDSLLD